MQQTPLGLLIWFVAIAVWLAWSPFEARPRGQIIFQLYPSVDLKTVAHLFFLIPIAVVLSVRAYGSDSRWAFVRAWSTIALFGLLLELGQWWVQGRGLSPYDILCNCVGATLALWGIDQLMRRRITAGPILVTLGVFVFTAIQVSAFHTVLMIRGRHLLANWEPSFVVLVGDEFGARRTYQGRVWNARICAGEPSREVCIAPEASVEERYQLTKAALDSQRVELSAYVLSSTDKQKGLARIVTFSKGAAFRNVTLAQTKHNLVFRVRTPWNGPNGTNPSLVLPDAVPTGIPTEVVATFARGVVIMIAQSQVRTVSTTFRPALNSPPYTLLEMLRSLETIPVLWHGRAAFVGAGILFLSFGLAVGYLLQSRWVVATLVGVAVSAFITWAVQVGVLVTLSPGAPVYLFAVSAAALGVGLATWDWNRIWRLADPSCGRRPVLFAFLETRHSAPFHEVGQRKCRYARHQGTSLVRFGRGGSHP